FAAT
ncbi:hypothetical protein D030_0763B, partial [Vibrio parahaemolyticus AQ3810]